MPYHASSEPVQLSYDEAGNLVAAQRRRPRQAHPPRVFGNGVTAFWGTVSLAHVCYPDRELTHPADRDFCRKQGFWS